MIYLYLFAFDFYFFVFCKQTVDGQAMKNGLGEPYEAYKCESKSFLMSFLRGQV